MRLLQAPPSTTTSTSIHIFKFLDNNARNEYVPISFENVNGKHWICSRSKWTIEKMSFFRGYEDAFLLRWCDSIGSWGPSCSCFACWTVKEFLPSLLPHETAKASVYYRVVFWWIGLHLYWLHSLLACGIWLQEMLKLFILPYMKNDLFSLRFIWLLLLLRKKCQMSRNKRQIARASNERICQKQVKRGKNPALVAKHLAKDIY